MFDAADRRVGFAVARHAGQDPERAKARPRLRRPFPRGFRSRRGFRLSSLIFASFSWDGSHLKMARLRLLVASSFSWSRVQPLQVTGPASSGIARGCLGRPFSASGHHALGRSPPASGRDAAAPGRSPSTLRPPGRRCSWRRELPAGCPGGRNGCG